MPDRSSRCDEMTEEQGMEKIEELKISFLKTSMTAIGEY
jgi:hypothetical protein